MRDCVAWIGREFGEDKLRDTDLILPTNPIFKRAGKTGADLAQHVLDQVKALAGMQDWPCRLEEQAEDPKQQVGEFTFVRGREQSPLGSFRVDARARAEPVITYNPKLVDDPQSLVATFAHELAHYLFATAQTDPPGGRALEEFATDLGAIFLGFGLFTVNSSYRFEAFGDVYGQGWQSTGAGYLSGKDQAYALALFVRFVGADEKSALTFLEPRHQGPFRKSLKFLDRNPEAQIPLDAAP